MDATPNVHPSKVEFHTVLYSALNSSPSTLLPQLFSLNSSPSTLLPQHQRLPDNVKDGEVDMFADDSIGSEICNDHQEALQKLKVYLIK